MLQRLFQLIVNPQVQRTLLENVAITIGRLGLVNANLVGQHLQLFIHPWLVTLAPIRPNEEKASAFSGLCEMIKAHPQGAANEFLLFCEAVAGYAEAPASLHKSFGDILNGYKNMFAGDQWVQALQTMAPEVKNPLHERYGI